MMKNIFRYILLVLLLIVAFPQNAHLQMLQGIVGGGSAAAVCTTPSTGNIHNEGFEGTGFDSGGVGGAWNLNESGTMDNDYSCPGTVLTGGCLQCLRANVAAGNAYSLLTLTTETDKTYTHTIVVQFYIASIALDGYSTFSIVILDDHLSNKIGYVKLYCDQAAQCTSATNLFIRFNTGSGGTSTQAISLATWHTLTIILTSGTAGTIKVDNGDAVNITKGDYGLKLLQIGEALGCGAGEALDISYAYMYVNAVAP